MSSPGVKQSGLGARAPQKSAARSRLGRQLARFLASNKSSFGDHGRGAGVGRGRGLAVDLGVAVAVGAGMGVGVAVGVGVA